ncbi:hypothetical protein IF2G_08736 [Cordyceps javanica]|nr:hypothetical protein IF2G_08736 [Cordyceps javanica]
MGWPHRQAVVPNTNSPGYFFFSFSFSMEGGVWSIFSSAKHEGKKREARAMGNMSRM